jgi:hypothetical protein
LKEVNYQNIFDLLSPAYDFPQTLETFNAWHLEAGLENIDVCRGYNGIEGHASVTTQISSMPFLPYQPAPNSKVA